MAKIFEPEYFPRDTVYLITDPEQLPRLVTAYCVKDNGVTYNVACGTQDSWHHGFEISKEKRERKGAGFQK